MYAIAYAFHDIITLWISSADVFSGYKTALAADIFYVRLTFHCVIDLHGSCIYVQPILFEEYVVGRLKKQGVRDGKHGHADTQHHVHSPESVASARAVRVGQCGHVLCRMLRVLVQRTIANGVLRTVERYGRIYDSFRRPEPDVRGIGQNGVHDVFRCGQSNFCGGDVVHVSFAAKVAVYRTVYARIPLW